MINLIKSDLYRLFRSKTYKNCILGSIGVTIFVLIIAIFTDVELWLMAFTGPEGLRRGFLIGLQDNTTFKELLINALGSGAGIYVVAITLTSSVLVSEKKCGMMKNTVAYGYERCNLYLSKLISLVVGISLIITVTYLAILLITGIVFTPVSMNLKDIFLIIKALVIYIFIVSSTVSIYMLFITIVPNSEVISVIAMCEIIGISMLGSHLPSKVNNWIPYSMIRTLAQVPESVKFIQCILIGLIIITISTYLGIIVFNKKEIK